MMNSEKSRIHSRLAGFGISCLVFGMKYTMLYRHVRILNTRHQIQDTLAKSCFSDFLRDDQQKCHKHKYDLGTCKDRRAEIPRLGHRNVFSRYFRLTDKKDLFTILI